MHMKENGRKMRGYLQKVDFDAHGRKWKKNERISPDNLCFCPFFFSFDYKLVLLQVKR